MADTDRKRDRYFDMLRGVAILRVVINHAFPFAILELAFPSMGVMFALGGSLMVKSIDQSAARAVRSRLRRLLPALWVMGLMLVPLMLASGWPDRPAWYRMLLWMFPIADPPANEWGMAGAGVLWYLVTYLWLVLLSPAMLKLYRRFPLPTVILPLGLLALSQVYPAALGEEYTGSPAWVIVNVLTFASCWLLGFAHRDGALGRLHPVIVVGLAAGCIGGSLGWAFAHPGDDGVNIVDLPVAYAVYSAGFVLLLLRWSPRMSWLARRRILDAVISLINARAVTIYLWHNAAITAAIIVGERLEVWRLGSGEYVAFIAMSLVLLMNVVLGLGWAEDLAARRPARLLPWPSAALDPHRGAVTVRHAEPTAPPARTAPDGQPAALLRPR